MAKIVGETMNNYLMFNRLLKCKQSTNYWYLRIFYYNTKFGVIIQIRRCFWTNFLSLRIRTFYLQASSWKARKSTKTHLKAVIKGSPSQNLIFMRNRDTIIQSQVSYLPTSLNLDNDHKWTNFF